MAAPIFPPRLPLYARTPPALFPLCLGVVGLSLVWERAANVFGFPKGISDVLMGMAGALYCAALFLYVRKVAARPAALRDDMRSPGGRGALSAASMMLLLLSYGVLEVAEDFARILWLCGMVMHGLLAGLLLETVLRMPRGARPPTPALFVPFVGQVVGAFAGVPLGYGAFCAALVACSLIIAIFLAGIVGAQMAKVGPQPPLRPQLAILLAPSAVIMLAHDALPLAYQAENLSRILFVIASITVLILLVRAPWLTEGGFTPVWAALTFPFSAYASCTLSMASTNLGSWWDALAAGALTATTLITCYVIYRFALAFRSGLLFPQPQP